MKKERKSAKKMLKANAEDSETSDGKKLLCCLYGAIWQLQVKYALCGVWAHQACTKSNAI